MICYLKIYTNLALILRIFEIALFVAILRSFYEFYAVFDLNYTRDIRVGSFFDVMRWGIVLAMGLLLILPNVFKKDPFSLIVFVSGIFSLVLNSSRGPILCFLIGFFVYVIFSKNFKKVFGALIVISAIIWGFYLQNSTQVQEFVSRMNSVSKFEESGSAARIFMWKHSLNFFANSLENDLQTALFGVGIKDKNENFKKYLTAKEEYIQLDEAVKRNVVFGDSHNAYLNTLIRLGLIYFIIYYLFLFYLILDMFLKFLKTKDEITLSAFCGVLAFCCCGMLYGYAYTYETFLFFFLLAIGLSKRVNLTHHLEKI